MGALPTGLLRTKLPQGPRDAFWKETFFDRDVWCGFSVNMFRGHRWLVPVCGRGHVNPRDQLELFLLHSGDNLTCFTGSFCSLDPVCQMFRDMSRAVLTLALGKEV